MECGKWGTLTEAPSSKSQVTNKLQISSRQARGLSANTKFQTPAKVVELSKTKSQKPRIITGFEEFDKVMGGGMVQGCLTLLGGDPGVGKSTLALQLAGGDLEILYISAEESEDQVASRLERLSAKSNKIKFINEDNLETILATIDQEKPPLTIIDSIQTIYTEEVEAEAGNLNQIRACTVKLLEMAKKRNYTIILIGHVTKEGELAGPKSMEHLVDTVLYLEGDKYKQYRLLRAAKNRFGSTGEIGILEMTKEGLRAVTNPSKIFLAGIHHQPGSVITAVAEGSQVFLVEVQALVSKTSSSYPKRQASGFDQKRLELLATVINKRANINLSNFDIYLNIAGGLTLKEPALDLAVCSSVLSAYQDQLLPEKSVIFGEVGLAGEVRSVVKTRERVKEAVKLGFKKIIMPYFESEVKGVEIIKVKELKEVIRLLR